MADFRQIYQSTEDKKGTLIAYDEVNLQESPDLIYKFFSSSAEMMMPTTTK
jgi:hypothetical protein